jgi:hypothetical protein
MRLPCSWSVSASVNNSQRPVRLLRAEPAGVGFAGKRSACCRLNFELRRFENASAFGVALPSCVHRRASRVRSVEASSMTRISQSLAELEKVVILRKQRRADTQANSASSLRAGMMTLKLHA